LVEDQLKITPLSLSVSIAESMPQRERYIPNIEKII